MEICDVCGHAFRMGWTAGMVADSGGEMSIFAARTAMMIGLRGLRDESARVHMDTVAIRMGKEMKYALVSEMFRSPRRG